MQLNVNPFRVGLSAKPELFAGRIDERLRIERALAQARRGSPCCVVLSGEPGLGKTSLSCLAAATAKGDWPSVSGEVFGFTPFVRRLEPGQNPRAALGSLVAELANAQRPKNGIPAFDPGEGSAEPQRFMSTVAERFKATLDGLPPDQNAALLILDGLRVSPLTEQLDQFWLDLLEQFGVFGVDRLCLCLVTEDKMPTVAVQAVPSLQILGLTPLNGDECAEAVTKGLSAANHINDVSTSVTDRALELIWKLSGGYPHLLQCLSYSAFEKDSDHLIATDDVMLSAFDENGGLALVAARYYPGLRPADLESKGPRAVLARLASKPDESVSLAALQRLHGGKSDQVSQVLRDMDERGLIADVAGEEGGHRIGTGGLATLVRCLVERDKVSRGAKADDATPLLFGVVFAMLGIVLLFQSQSVPILLGCAAVTLGVTVITGSRRAHRALRVKNRTTQAVLIRLALLLALSTLVLFILTLARL